MSKIYLDIDGNEIGEIAYETMPNTIRKLASRWDDESAGMIYELRTYTKCEREINGSGIFPDYFKFNCVVARGDIEWANRISRHYVGHIEEI